MSGGEKKRKIGTHAAGNKNRRLLRHDFAQKLCEILHMIDGIDRLGRPLGFSKSDEVGSNDFMVDGGSGVNFRPLVGGCSQKKTMKEDNRLTRPADMIDELALGSGNGPRRKNRGGDFIWYDAARRALAVLQGECQSPENAHSDSETDKGVSLPEWGHGTGAGCPPALPGVAAGELGNYQLDFVTPGMRPEEASSRKVIREI